MRIWHIFDNETGEQWVGHEKPPPPRGNEQPISSELPSIVKVARYPFKKNETYAPRGNAAT